MKILYEIEIGKGLLCRPESIAQKIKSYGSRFAMITHENLAKLFAERWMEGLKKEGLNIDLFTFPSGEEHKTREMKAELEDQLLEKGFGRDSCILAIGGGVVTDLVGFLAATYCRGIPFVSIPTSLLAMVDSSVGGKTGVNTHFGKNLIGSIYQPKKVLIDLEALLTLPKKNLIEGVAEMIKHGLIADPAYFSYLEKNSEAILNLNFDVLEKAIIESCKIKKEIVEEDERETGRRRLLNLGHTVGHALEKLSNYTISHGEAVAIGLIVEGKMGVNLGYFPQGHLDRLVNILKLYGLPLKIPSSIKTEDILKAMVLDKKSVKGKPRFVMLKEIGSPLPFNDQFCTEVKEAVITKAIAENVS